MHLRNHRFSKIPPKKFDRFLPWKVALRIIRTNYVKPSRAEICQIFLVVFWKINDFLNTFRYYLTFSGCSLHITISLNINKKNLISSICNKRMITFFRMKSNKGLNEINIIAPETRPMPPSR